MEIKNPAEMEVANIAREQIKGIRAGSIEDKFGWVHPIEIAVPV